MTTVISPYGGRLVDLLVPEEERDDLRAYASTLDKVVFLADKLVQDDKVVGLEARFAARLERFAGDPEALAGVCARLEEARLVQARLEAVLGRPPGDAAWG